MKFPKTSSPADNVARPNDYALQTWHEMSDYEFADYAKFWREVESIAPHPVKAGEKVISAELAKMPDDFTAAIKHCEDLKRAYLADFEDKYFDDLVCWVRSDPSYGMDIDFTSELVSEFFGRMSENLQLR